MKTIYSVFAGFLLMLTGCSTVQQSNGAKADPETVMVNYRVQPGKEAEFQALLSHAWGVYRSEHLVFAEPHIIVRDTGDDGKVRFVEIFTWIKSPDHAPDSVKAVWQQEQSLCEARSGHKGIEGGEVEIVTGR
jgi:antibiotic biosynthesis monooxygenase (ABM) superfamily enzyme